MEATGVPDVGARIAVEALAAGIGVATLTVESDVTIGRYLAQLADESGALYSVCRGDEPVETKILVDYARDLNFEVICAGKGKNNPLDRYATPESLAERAATKQMNPKMLTSFVDGSKAMIEMASLANTTGLGVSTRGMHGPASTVPTLHQTFALKEDGGILDRAGVVDYCTGPVAPGRVRGGPHRGPLRAPRDDLPADGRRPLLRPLPALPPGQPRGTAHGLRDGRSTSAPASPPSTGPPRSAPRPSGRSRPARRSTASAG